MKKNILNRHNLRILLKNISCIEKDGRFERLVQIITSKTKNTEFGYYAELKYFKEESVVTISLNNHISTSTVERFLKKYIDSIIIDIITSGITEEFEKAYRLISGGQNG